jgi:hypothetical protein
MSFLCPACGASSVFTIGKGDSEGDAAQTELTKVLIANLKQALTKLAEGKSDEAPFRIESTINILSALKK